MKLYAKQIPPDIQQPLFPIEEEEYYDPISIFGNRAFKPILRTPVLQIKAIIDDTYLNEIINIAQEIKHQKDEQQKTEKTKDLINLISDFFVVDKNTAPKLVLDPASAYATHLINDPLATIPYPNAMPNTNGYLLNLCQGLNIITNHTWSNKAIYGSAQGEWNNIVYPDDVFTPKDIDTLSCLYWNEGTEWSISDCYPEDNDDTQRTIEEIEFEYGHYSILYDTEDIKQEIAQMNDISPNDVTLFVFEKYIKTPDYKRE